MRPIIGKALMCILVQAFTCTLVLADDSAPPSTEQPRAAWADKRPASWPQILLGHDMTFRNGDKLEGASAFLLRLDAANVIGVSAKHVLGDGQDLATLPKQVTNWRLTPRSLIALGSAPHFVQLRRLAVKLPDAEQADWLAATAATSGKWAAEPLIPRTKPLLPGETIYLIAVPYAENRSQNVYEATVVDERDPVGQFWFDFSPAVQTRGFSGAPIVDADGLCVGMYVAHANDRPGPNKTRGVGLPITDLLSLIDESKLAPRK